MTQPLKFDIAAVMPGAASLGAYQAGAAAALVTGRNALVEQGHEVNIPALGGASAGATVALLAAHALAQGLDPVPLLSHAWVDGVDIELLATGRAAPLGHAALREQLVKLLTERSEWPASSGAPQTDVAIHIALTTLRGYRYELHELGDHPTDAVTYADWSAVKYPAGGDPEALCDQERSSPLDVVLASLANPVVFPPKLLDRTSIGAEYVERGLHDVTNKSSAWWFTDGGLVQTRPISRTLELVPPSDKPIRCVVIDPRSEDPTTGETWADPHQEADWRGALLRAMSIFPAQILSDELRRIDDQNRSHRALTELAGMLEASDPAALRSWLDRHDVEPGDDPILAALFTAAGLETAEPIRADVIHPLLVAEEADVPSLLAGELLGDFAGFLSRDLRRSDFSLGYACTTTWWENVLAEQGLGEERAPVLEHLEEYGPPPWRAVDRGDTKLGDIPLRRRAPLVRVALRTVRALLRRQRAA